MYKEIDVFYFKDVTLFSTTYFNSVRIIQMCHKIFHLIFKKN